MLLKRVRPIAVLFALVAIVALTLPAAAPAYVVPMSIEQLTAQADTVAEVRIREAKPRAEQSQARVVRIETDIDMQVTGVLKGNGRTAISLTQPGGTVGDITLSVTDMPAFEPGEHAIVFLDGNGVIGGTQGKLEIIDGTVPALGMTVAEARRAIREIVRTGSTSVVGTAGFEVAGAEEGDSDSGVVTADAPVVLFDSTFESASTAGWSFSGNPTWAPTTYRARNGSYSLYGAGGGSAGVSAPGPSPVAVYATATRTSAFDLRSYSVATLSWDVWTGLTNVSGNWVNVRIGTSSSGPWYTPAGYFAMGSGQGWRNFQLDLRSVTCQFSGETIDFTKQPQVWISVIHRHTDGASDEGVYVDNVRLTAEDIPTPTIEYISPSFVNANTGDHVTIHGIGFGSSPGTGGRVEFLRGDRQDGSMVAATVVDSWSDDRITVAVPRYAQPGPVRVVDSSGVSSGGYFYEVGYGNSGVSWDAADLPVTFRINENTADTTGEGAAIAAAMQTWSNAGSNMHFAYGGSATTSSYPPQRDEHNDIFFTRETMPTGVLAQCFYWYSGSRIIESDIVFNDSAYTWTVGASAGKFDIESVALHELGHTVGIDDQYGALDRAMGAIPSGQTRRGLHIFEIIAAMDLYGLDGTKEMPRPLAVEPIAGASRFATAVEISKRAYPDGLAADGVRTVVLATGRNWPDALGGTALAGVLDGPVLLVDPNSVPAVVTTEIARLGAQRAIILGGEGAVSATVQAAVASQLGGTDRVERIAGTTRYETADKVAARVLELRGGAWDGTALVATGANYPDALAVSPLAAANGWPLFLAHPSRGLAEESLAVMGTPARVLLLGGTGALSGAVESDLHSRFGETDVLRLSGGDRYSTAVAVANYGVEYAGLSWDGVAIATGQNFPDALAGGALQGSRGSVMVLTRTSSICDTTLSKLALHKSGIDRVSYLGGTSAVCEDVRETVRQALQ